MDYDNLGRLTGFRGSAADVAIEQYAYDATGNRLSFANASGLVPYAYEATSHRLNGLGSSVRTYDAAGNTITTDGGAKEFVYNQGNRLSQVKLGGIVAQNYAYNARGERVQRGLDAASSVFTTYDESGRWLGDYDSLGNPKQQVIWMDDMPVGLLANGVLYYVEPDHLGTPRLVLDPLRNVPVWTWDIKGEAFGNSVPNQDPDIDGQDFVFDMRFPGQRYDAVSGLNYNYYRDYDPSAGRYVQSDPIGLGGGVSTYGYGGGNPLGMIDLLGSQSSRRVLPPSYGWPGAYNPNDPTSYDQYLENNAAVDGFANAVGTTLDFNSPFGCFSGEKGALVGALIDNVFAMSPAEQWIAEYSVFDAFKRAGIQRDPDRCKELKKWNRVSEEGGIDASCMGYAMDDPNESYGAALFGCTRCL